MAAVNPKSIASRVRAEMKRGFVDATSIGKQLPDLTKLQVRGALHGLHSTGQILRAEPAEPGGDYIYSFPSERKAGLFANFMSIPWVGSQITNQGV